MSHIARVGPYRFYADGSCSQHGPLGGLVRDRSPVVDYSFADSVRNKPAPGRVLGALMTGGLSMALTPGTTGKLMVLILTEDWASTWTGPPSFTGMQQRLVEQLALAQMRQRNRR